MIESILKLLKASATKLEPSSVYRARAAEIDLAAAAAAVDAARARRDAVLLRGTDAEAEVAERDVAAAVREHDRLRLARGELERLAGDAEKRETLEAIEATAAGARDANAQLIGLYVRADELAAELAETLGQIVKQRSVIKVAAAATAEAGRPDLRVRDPLAELAQHLGLPTTDHLIDPIVWQLRGYWSAIEPRTNLDRRLGQARELLTSPERGRKAA